MGYDLYELFKLGSKLLVNILIAVLESAHFMTGRTTISGLRVKIRYNLHTFQLLELVGYPVMEENDEKEEWYLSYADESIESAFEIVDSALLQIDRELDKSFFNAKPSP